MTWTVKGYGRALPTMEFHLNLLYLDLQNAQNNGLHSAYTPYVGRLGHCFGHIGGVTMMCNGAPDRLLDKGEAQVEYSHRPRWVEYGYSPSCRSEGLAPGILHWQLHKMT